MSRFLLVVFVAIGWASVLSGAPPVDMRVPKTDSFGDPLPKGVIARLGTIRWKGSERMMGLALSPDGKFVAAVCGDARIRVWAYPTGVLLRQYALDRPEQQAAALAFSSDQKQIIFGGFNVPAPRSLDLATGKVAYVGRPTGPGVPLITTVSSNGRHVLSYENEGLVCRLLVTEVARPNSTREIGILRMKGQIGGLRAIIAPDGRWVAVCAMEVGINMVASRIHLFDTTTGKSSTSAPMPGLIEMASLVFSDDSKSLAVAASHQMFRLEIKAKDAGPPEVRVACQFQKLHPQGNFDVERLLFSPDGKLLIGGDADGQVGVWDANTGKPLRHIPASLRSSVSGLAVSPDSKSLLVVNVLDSTVRLFDLASGQDLTPRTGHRGAVSDVAFHPSGKAIVSSSFNDGSIRTWDLTPKRTTITGRNAVVEDRIRGWEYAVIEEFGQSFMNAAFADRGRLLFATTPDSVFVWDTSKSQKRAASFNVNVERRGFAVSPDGKVVAIALQESGVALHDARTGASIVKPPTTNEPINSMFFSADGKTFAATTTEGRLLCWDLATGQQRRPTPDSRKGVAQRYFASAIEVDQTLLIWDCITGRIVRRVDDCPQPSALSPDGRYLASATALGIVLRETLSGKNIHQTFANLPGPPSVLRFSPDGSVLAASYSDGTILLWDARPTMTRINSEKFDGLWKALGDDDPTIAFAAMGALLASPKEAIALLKDKVKPAAPIAPEIVAQLLVDLNHPKYLVREKATKRLEVIANQIEESLELALIRANPEVERRIERALQAIRQPIASKEQLQSFRVIAVLEWIGTPDARELLGRLAQDEGPLARDARDCLARLIVR